MMKSDMKAENDVFLVDHAWLTQFNEARKQLRYAIISGFYKAKSTENSAHKLCRNFLVLYPLL